MYLSGDGVGLLLLVSDEWFALESKPCAIPIPYRTNAGALQQARQALPDSGKNIFNQCVHVYATWVPGCAMVHWT